MLPQKRPPLPQTIEEILEQLNNVISISKEGLEADNKGDYPSALSSYSNVISIILDLLFVLNRQNKRDLKQTQTLEDKLDKYLSRVNVLWTMIDREQKLQYGLYSPTTTPAKSLARPTGFIDIATSFSNVIELNLELEPFVPYSSDPYIRTMEKVQRLARSIKYGAFIKADLFVASDVWLHTFGKLESVDAKQSALQSLAKPLSKLTNLLQNNENQANFSLFKSTCNEFVIEIEAANIFLGKVVRYQREKDDKGGQWSIKFFKPKVLDFNKLNSYIILLLSFLDQSSNVFLFWLNKTVGEDRHPESAAIREYLGRMVEFYKDVILPMCYQDLEILIPHFIKKARKIILD